MTEQRANAWLAAWRQAVLDHLPCNRREAHWLWILAAQAQADPSLARRMSIVEVLEDGRPYSGPDLRAAVESRLGEGCFGAQAEQTLEADIAALCDWGICIIYSDSPEVEGYYLKDPAVETSHQRLYEEPNPLQIEAYRAWDNARKMRSMFEMFEFALQQARIGTRSRHPDWDDEQVEAEVRRLVTGSEPVSVILTKLQAYQNSGSTRHLDDIEGILRVSGPELGLAYIDREAARMGVFGTWRELLERSGLV